MDRMKIDDQTWDFVCETLTDLQRQIDTHDAAINAIRLPPESPLVKPFYELIEAVVSCLRFMLYHENGHYVFCDIWWFVFECDFGRSELEAKKSNGESRVIKTLDDLRWLIEDLAC